VKRSCRSTVAARHTALWGLAIAWIGGAGCDFPGRPNPADAPRRPEQVTDFEQLYRQNCSGCHGADGTLGPAPPLADPLFAQLIPTAELTKVISQGRPGTLMPPMARERGGPLTMDQVKILAQEIKSRWAGKTSDAGAPAYLATATEKPASQSAGRGAEVFARACASCHGTTGHGTEEGSDAGAINEPAFLALFSDQALRRTIITGRPDLGMPDYASGDDRSEDFRPLSSDDVADLVALLASWRKAADKP
jgi:cytochrome c oxidase cbb3-type subunit III